MSLYNKYRPKSLNEVIGNTSAITTLEGMLKDTSKTPHTFLLTGPTGCGKTTVARIIANTLGVSETELNEINSADSRGIDTIREIHKRIKYKPILGNISVWVIDEAHQLTKDAQTALLKTLEDTPEYVYFILATTDPKKLIPTVRGRCSIIEMKPLSDDEMFALLRGIAKKEDKSLTKIIYDNIIKASEGRPREAIQILEQVLSTDLDLQIEVSQGMDFIRRESIELCRLLLKKGSWGKVSAVIRGLENPEPESIRYHVLGYAKAVLLNNGDVQSAKVIQNFEDNFYDSGMAGLVLACWKSIH
jgi:DNA polymerase-3 subunit gamma/tau